MFYLKLVVASAIAGLVIVLASRLFAWIDSKTDKGNLVFLAMISLMVGYIFVSAWTLLGALACVCHTSSFVSVLTSYGPDGKS